MEKIKLLIIDEKMTTAEIEIEPGLFKQLNIDPESVKEHKSKTALNKEISIFLNSTLN